MVAGALEVSSQEKRSLGKFAPRKCSQEKRSQEGSVDLRGADRGRSKQKNALRHGARFFYLSHALGMFSH